MGPLIVCVLLLAFAFVGHADAVEIKVLSAGAMKTIVGELAEEFHRETGHVVSITAGTVGQLRDRIVGGERADVVIMSDTAIDQLIGRGLLAVGSRVDIARTGIGVAVREGAPPPDISTPEALRQTLLAAKSIAYIDPASGGTSGIHFASILDRLGITDAVKGKSLLRPGGFVAELVARGEAELCVHQISEILPVKGVTLVGPLPRELQKITVYSAALPARETTEPARTFVEFLARPEFKSRLAAAGLDYRP
jgi:molybdate transport system substrate-binding protein